MQFKDAYQNIESFSKTIKNLMNNSVDIEQSSEIEDFINPEIQHFKTSDHLLKFNENILLTKYAKRIRASCKVRVLKVEEKAKYNLKPELLSTDEYYTPDLWYLILYCNDCESFMEFRDLNYVLLPDINVVHNCLANDEFIKNKNTK